MPRQEARRHPRISFTSEVWLGQDGVFTRTAERFSDLSAGGAFIELRHLHQLGSVLNLRFSLPVDSHFIDCTAVVRSTRGTQGIGVEFLDLSPENVGRIRSFIDDLRV